MLLQIVASTGLKYSPSKIFQCSAKKYNKFSFFLTAAQLRVCRNFSVSRDNNFFEDINVQKYLNYITSEAGPEICGLQRTESLLSLLKKKEKLESEIKNLESISSENDKELEKLIETEKQEHLDSIEQTKTEILDCILPRDDDTDDRNAEVKIVPGIGGEEAKLFGQELLDMYVNYANFKNWECFREESTLLINGDYVFGLLKQDAGVHRVQRVPVTETSGRTQSSTVSVVVLPQPRPGEIQLLEKDIVIEKMKSSGPGGQNVNKRETAIRIRHLPTGILVDSQSQRYQKENLKEAKRKLMSILFNLKQKEVLSERRTTAKEQIGLIDYSDKIRTYNFQQNRVTDHRINYTFPNIRVFMSGEKQLDHVIKQVRRFNLTNELLGNIKKTLESVEYKEFEKQQIG